MSTKPGKTKPNTSDLKDGGKGTSDDGKNKKGSAGGSSLKGSGQSENGARVNPSNIEIGGPPLTDHTLDNLEDDMSAFDRDKKTPSLTISLDLINDAVASALSHFKKQPGVKLSGVMSKDEVEQVFMDIFAQVSSTTSSMLTPEITTLRKLAHTMEQNAKETREIQNQVLMLMQQGATEKVVAKTVQELVPNPAIARNNKKIVEGLMSLGVMFENPEKKLKLSKALSVLKPNEILKFVEACAGETPDGIRELFKKYKK